MRTFNYVGRYSENTFFCTRKLFQRSGTKLSDIQIFGNLYLQRDMSLPLNELKTKCFDWKTKQLGQNPSPHPGLS